MPDPRQLDGQRVLVMGLGAFGGGAGAARALVQLGARVAATDLRDADELPEARALLDGFPIECSLGGHDEEMFRSADLIVVNPGVPSDSAWLEIARKAATPLTTELNLALSLLHTTPCFAVTGTHGKSSTTALAHHLLGGAGQALLGGNLGGSLLEAALSHQDGTPLVLELSSFQLEPLQVERGWPQVAALTCLRPDHLDRHGDMATYAAAKLRLVEAQTDANALLLPAEEPYADPWMAASEARPLRVCRDGSDHLGPSDGWFLNGTLLVERLDGTERTLATLGDAPRFAHPFLHTNLLLAIGGARLLGAPAESIAPRLRSWPGLPHRMEELAGPPGVRCIDNGVATHPEPTAAAVSSLPGQLCLIAGGKDKGVPLEPLLTALTREPEPRLFLHGEGGERLASALKTTPHSLHATTAAAIAAAFEAAVPGTTVLYSPTFSSFDEFRNFAERAQLFREACRSAESPA